jgi:hypothetical protein
MLKLKPGIITGEGLKELFAYCKDAECALPSVNVIGSNSANAAMAAAHEAKAPIIIQFSNTGAQFIAGTTLDNRAQQASIAGSIAGALHVRTLAKRYGVAVVLHTDHCAKKLLPWVEGVIAVGEESAKAIPGRAAVAVASRLGVEPIYFPGGHDGFLGGEPSASQIGQHKGSRADHRMSAGPGHHPSQARGRPPGGSVMTFRPTQRASADVAGGNRMLNFDVHGLFTMAVDKEAPTSDQLSTIFAAFRTDGTTSRPDIVVKGIVEPRRGMSLLEDELAYDDEAVLMPRSGVQIVHSEGRWEVQGAGELLTTVLPVLDQVLDHGGIGEG